MKLLDMLGKKIGRWSVISRDYDKEVSASNRNAFWKCICDCGTIKSVRGADLRSGDTNSCGCLNREAVTKTDEKVALTQIYRRYKASAKERQLEFLLTKEELLMLIQKPCFYCGTAPSNIYNNAYKNSNHSSYLYTGVDRVDNTKGYVLNNCVSCCQNCNRAKKDMAPTDFIDWIERIYANKGTWNV